MNDRIYELINDFLSDEKYIEKLEDRKHGIVQDLEESFLKGDFSEVSLQLARLRDKNRQLNEQREKQAYKIAYIKGILDTIEMKEPLL